MSGGLLRLLVSGRLSMANFAITNACNASCRHCSFPSVRVKRTVPLDDAVDAIDALHRLGVGVLSVTGGEPFTVPHLPEIVAHATRRGMVVYTGTNGSLTTEDTIQRLSDAGIAAVWVSVEGPDASTLEDHRGLAGLAEDVRRTVGLLREHGVPAYAICALNRNVLDIDHYMGFVADLGLSSVKFDYPMTSPAGSSYMGYGDDPCLQLSLEEREGMVDRIIHHKSNGSPVRVINPTEGLRGFLAHSRQEAPRYRCPAGRHVVFLDWDLGLWRCTQLGDRLGDVRDMGPGDLAATDCDRCYYQGCRDYAPLFHLVDVLRGKASLDGRLPGAFLTLMELGRTDLV